MKLLVDMCLPPVLADLLNEAGHEAVHWSRIGDPAAADNEIFTWALEHKHVVLTHDLDFNDLLYSTRGSGPSVVIIREQDTSPGTILEPIVQILTRFRKELEAGALISLGKHSARIRQLPLH